MGGFDSQLRASFTYFGQLLHFAHKHIIDIMKVYIIAYLLTFETLKWEYTFVTDALIATRDESPLVCSGGAGRFGT